MGKDMETRMNEMANSIAHLSASVSKLWEVNANGIPPHKRTVKMMWVLIVLTFFSFLIGLLILIEGYLLLYKVSDIYTLLLNV